MTVRELIVIGVGVSVDRRADLPQIILACFPVGHLTVLLNDGQRDLFLGIVDFVTDFYRS